jgi:cob(I)alamin adenosyltransferase
MGFKIYTKTGDDGTTGLVGGSRVKKSDLRLETYGTVDELNSWLGLIRSMVDDLLVSELLLKIQKNLFIMGSKLASDEKGKQITGHLTIKTEEIENLEKAIDQYEMHLRPLQNFILPGGSQLIGFCHIARTVCRRAERRIVQLSGITTIEEGIIRYMNRLSDYLFVLSRKVASDEGIMEVTWNSAG